MPVPKIDRLEADRIEDLDLYHSRDYPEVLVRDLSYYQEHLPTALSRQVDGSEHCSLTGFGRLSTTSRACLAE